MAASDHTPLPGPTPESDLEHAKRWALTWLGIGLWGLIAVLALFGAAEASSHGAYVCALLAAAGALAMVLVNLKRYLDGKMPRILPDVLVSRVESLMVLIPVMAALGVVGLFLAASARSGGVEYAGYGLFLAACITVFLSIKNCFDTAEAAPHPAGSLAGDHSIGPSKGPSDPLRSHTL